MNRKRLFALLCAALLLIGPVTAMDMPPTDMMGPPPDGGPGSPGGPPGGGAPEQAAIVITDGTENPDAEYDPGAYSALITEQDGDLILEGLELGSGDYGFNGLVVTGPDSVLRLRKATVRLNVAAPAASGDSGGAAVNLDNGATVYISDSNLIVDGAARYVTAAYNDATLVVNNSLVQSTGSNENTAEIAEPFSNEALLISGTARANFSIGATKTYYFNSTCTAEGWAALSTDSATGDGLDLYAYNTDGIAENGGYGTYADTNCRVWLYGSRLNAAEIGAIISKSGQIHAYSAKDAGEDLLQYNEGPAADTETSIIGGRNALMIHAPDMMGGGIWAADCGYFDAENAYIGTSADLKSTKDYYDYGEAVGAYIDYVSGSDILLRSTSAKISLNHCTMESYNNTLVHTVLNADSMGNFLAPGDGDQVEPIEVTMRDMEVTGDIRHEDYQRRMTVLLDSQATLSGSIIGGTMESWNETWKDYGAVNWVVDDSFDAEYGVALELASGAVWNVTGDSNLTRLVWNEGAEINGVITLDGQEITEPGVYEGTILVTGDYVPEEALPEDASQDEASDSEIASVTEAPAESPEPTPQTASPSPAVPQETAPEAPAGHAGLIAGIVAALIAAAAVCFLLIRRKKK